MFNNKLHIARALMIATIAVIFVFQVWWLGKNYNRERQALEKQTAFIFHETVFGMQARQLQHADSVDLDYPMSDPANIIGVTNALKRSYKKDRDVFITRTEKEFTDTAGDKKSMQSVIISLHDSAVAPGKEQKHIMVYSNAETKGRLFNLLLQVDSLQDSLPVQTVVSKTDSAFKAAGYKVPFTVERNAQAPDTGKLAQDGLRLLPNQVPVGFAHPYILQLTLGNTMPYVLRSLLLPLCFSVFLLAVTVISFLFLYRNLVQQNKLNTLKSSFISNITHELKTPVATVAVAIEALKSFSETGSTEKTKEYLEISGQELQRLNLLIDKVLRLSLLEQADITLHYEIVNISTLVAGVASAMRLLLERQHAAIQIVTPGDVYVNGDSSHLQSVIFNLVDNALKYSIGSPEIHISIVEEGNDIIVSVSDKGVGIAPGYRYRIFEKFFRVPSGDTHDAKGYGLGLSYVKQIVEKHGGSISVTSQEGKGSTFIIVLPNETA